MKTVMVCLEKCAEADKLAKELLGKGLKVRLGYIIDYDFNIDTALA